MQSFDRLPSKPNRLRAIATGAILSILIGVSTWSIGVPRAGEWSGFDVGLNRRLGPIHFSQSDSAVWVANGNLFRFNGIRFVQVDSIRAAWSTLQSSGGDFWIGSAADTLLRLGPGTPADTLVLGLPAAWQVPSGCGDFFEFCSRGSGGITSLAEDATGNLWVAVAGRGLVQLDPLTSSWQVIDLSGVAADPTVTPATIEFSPADSSIWVLLRGACELCTGSFSVNLPSDSRTKLIKLSLAGQILEQFAVTEARDVAIDSTGVAWVVGANGLSSFDHTGVESSPVWQGGDFTLDGDLATSIAIGPFGDLWLTLQDRLISGAGRGVLRIDRTLGQFTRFQQGDGLSSDWSARLFLDRFGMLWVAGYAGKIDRYTGSAWKDIRSSESSELEVFQSKFEFQGMRVAWESQRSSLGNSVGFPGRVWAAPDFGEPQDAVLAALLSPDTIRSWIPEIGCNVEPPFGVALIEPDEIRMSPDGDGGLWFVRREGMRNFSTGEEFERFAFSRRNRDGQIDCPIPLEQERLFDPDDPELPILRSDTNGGLWILSSGGVVPAFWDGVGIRFLPRGPSAAAPGITIDIDIARNGSVWFLLSGVDEVDPQEIRAYRFEPRDSTYSYLRNIDGLAGLTLTSVASDGMDGVWLSSPNRVIHWQPSGVRVYGESDGLPSEGVVDLSPGPGGTIWAGARRDSGSGLVTGAAFYSPTSDRWGQVTTREGLPRTFVEAVLAQDGGVLFAHPDWTFAFYRPDLRAPAARFLTSPLRLSADCNPTIAIEGGDFEGENDELTFSYSLDGGTPVELGGSRVFQTPIGIDGTHTIEVWARDRSLNVSAPASVEFTLDCTPPTVTLASPRFGDPVRDVVSIIGAVQDVHFESYSISARPRGEEQWGAIASNVATQPAPGSPLGQWDTRDLSDGVWELRITGRDSVGLVASALIEVIVDNQLPRADDTTPVLITREQGGVVFTTAGDIEVYLPPRFLERDGPVEIQLDVSGVPDTLPEGQGWLVPAFRLEWGSVQENKWADLRIRSESAGAGAGEVYRLMADSTWAPVGGTYDASGRVISVATQRTGIYAVFATQSLSSNVTGIPAVTLSPRILRLGAASTRQEIAIGFTLSRAGPVTVKIYDRAGRLIRDLVRGETMIAGSNIVRWDGRKESGVLVPDGAYVISVRTPSRHQTAVLAVAR